MKLNDIIKKRKEQAEERKLGNDSAYKLKEGKTQLRILPGWREDDDTFFHDFGMHFVKDAKGDLKGVHVCPRATYDEECPTCNAIGDAFGYVRESMGEINDSDDSVKALKKANAGNRILLNVVVRGDKRSDDSVEVIDIPRSLFENDIISLFEEYGEQIIATEDGLDITVNATGSGFDRKYTVMPTSPKNNVKDVTKEQLEARKDIDKWIKAQNWEQERVNKAIATVGSIVGIEVADGGRALENKASERRELDNMLDESIEDAEYEPADEPEAEASEEKVVESESDDQEAEEKAKAEEEAKAKREAEQRKEAEAKAKAEEEAKAKAEAEKKASEEKQVVGGDAPVAESSSDDDLDDILGDL